MLPVPALVSQVADEFLRHMAFEIGAKGGFKHNGHPIARDAKFFFLAIEHCPPLKVALEARPDYGDLAKSAFSVALANEIYARVRASQRVAEAEKVAGTDIDLSEIYLNDSIKTPLSKLKIIYNVKGRRRSAIYDTLQDCIYSYDHDITLEILKARLGNDGRAEYLSNHAEHCVFSYVPGRPRIAFDKDGTTEHKIFNLWSEATWRKGWVPNPEAKLPGLLVKFLDFFIEDADDRRTSLAWLHDMTFGKADPILILCGEPGIGKNLFVQKLATAMVGATNYREAARGFKDSAFHNNVSQCRLFFMDEMELTVSARDTLKSYHNGTAAIERKGIDVSDPEPIHASFVVANNFQKYIRLEYTDRKFFAPKLSKSPLEGKMSLAEIRELIALLDGDVEALRNIASYLHTNFKQGSSKTFVKTEFFEALCIQSYPAYFQRFILACRGYEKFTNKTFNRTNRYGSEPLDLKTLIEHYKSTFKKPLATMEIRGDGSWVVTSEIYDPTVLDVQPVAEKAKPAAYKNGNGADHGEPMAPPELDDAVPML